VIAPAGSTLWLLRHELRLTWRGIIERRRGRGRFARLWVTVALPLILMLLAGVPLAFVLRHVREIPINPLASLIGVAIVAVAFTLMLSQTLAAAVDALYERADLDLLFSSPMAPRRVLAVRFLAVSFSVFAFFGMILGPILLPIAVMGHPSWLAALLVLFCVALAASGAGLLLAAGLFRVIGPRRTRTLGQVLAAILGAAFFLIAQARNILGGAKTAGLAAVVVQLAKDPRFQAVPGLSWPLRALLGEPLPLLAAIGLGGGVFLIANQILGARFAADAAAAAGAGVGGKVSKSFGRLQFSADAFAATFLKEIRLIARDPALIAQVLLRVLYMLPVGFVILRQAGQAQTLALPGSAAALSLMAGQVAGSLAWITISAEDAPDLLSCAPTPTRTLRRAKLAAAVAPVAVMLAPVILPLAVLAPWAAFSAALGCTASVAMAAMMNVWWQRPGKRSEFRRRRSASWMVTMAELLLGFLIAASTGLFAAGLIGWSVLPAVLALVGVLLLSRSDAQIARSLRAAS